MNKQTKQKQREEKIFKDADGDVLSIYLHCFIFHCFSSGNEINWRQKPTQRRWRKTWKRANNKCWRKYTYRKLYKSINFRFFIGLTKHAIEIASFCIAIDVSWNFKKNHFFFYRMEEKSPLITFNENSICILYTNNNKKMAWAFCDRLKSMGVWSKPVTR